MCKSYRKWPLFGRESGLLARSQNSYFVCLQKVVVKLTHLGYTIGVTDVSVDSTGPKPLYEQRDRPPVWNLKACIEHHGGIDFAARYSEMVQRRKGLRFHSSRR